MPKSALASPSTAQFTDDALLLLSREELKLLTTVFIKGHVALQGDESFRSRYLSSPDQLETVGRVYGMLIQSCMELNGKALEASALNAVG